MLQVDTVHVDDVPDLGTCEDTPGWKNGFTKRLLSCQDYARWWCSSGTVLDRAVTGQLFNYPERNCQACGKCSSNNESFGVKVLLRRKPVTSDTELRRNLQDACDIESATIPLYLSALFSLRENAAPEAEHAIRDIVVEEMLHLNIVANMLYAVGGHPRFTVPRYTAGLLPFDVSLGKLSRKQLETFMTIEQPASGPPSAEHWTIGEFYTDMKNYAVSRGDVLFQNFHPRPVFRTGANQINNSVSAARGLNLIVSQGEGSSQSPIDMDGELSHYYKFSQIYHGKKIVDRGDGIFTHDGEPVSFNETSDVYDLVANASQELYRNSAQNFVVWELNKRFNFHFTDMLRCLEVAFHDFAAEINECVGIMFVVKSLGNKIVTLPVYAENGEMLGNGAPTWDYMPKL